MSIGQEPRNERIRWLRRGITGIVTICVYAVITLISVEALMRVLGFTPWRVAIEVPGPGISMPDDRLGWINRPGTFISPEAGRASMTFLGDHSRRSWKASLKTKQQGEVLLVGCSFTQGFGVADENTFAYLLNEQYPHLMFRNFGTGGYGTYQSLLRLKENLASVDSAPIALVIYGFIGLHLQRNVATPNWVRSLATRRGEYVVPPHVRLSTEGLQYYPLETISFWPLESDSALVTSLANVYLQLRLRQHGPELRVTTALVAQMNQAVVSQHKRFLTVLLDRPPTGLVEFLNTQQISYANCDNAAFDEIPSSFRLGGTGHPNATQNMLWAACIAHWIDREMPTLANR